MPTGDFPTPEGMMWTDACGWVPRGPSMELKMSILEDADFRKSVNGWKQAVGIVRKLRDGLQFTVNEINENKGAFAPSQEKAEAFEKARQALRTADAYLAAMDSV